MEYVSYILITLGILVACLLLMRLPALPEQRSRRVALPAKSVERAGQKRDTADLAEDLRSKLVPRRDQQPVLTPWGWPGHHGPASIRRQSPPNAQEVHGVSESLHHFVDRLFTAKHTVDNQEYLLRKEASLRSLVEDRFGNASTMKEIPYSKVKPPRLRDPAEPHDQMDNFPSGKVDQIASRIPRQSGLSNVAQQTTRMKKTVGLADMRTPWGW